jgi:DUF4097 and DUF4098 domain-containing protein YvlB
MKKSVKITLIIGTCFLLVGLVFWGVSARTDEFKRLAAAAGLTHAPAIGATEGNAPDGAQPSEAQGNNIGSNREALGALLSENESMSEFFYQAQGDADSLDIRAETRNIYIIPAEVDQIEIKSYENEDSMLKASLEGGTLKIEEELKKKLVNISDFFSFDFKGSENADRSLYIYVPSDTKLRKLISDSSFGDTKIRSFSAGELTITSSNGDIDITDMIADAATAKTSFGDIKVNRLTADGKLNLASSNGKIDVKSSASTSAEVTSSFGNISLSDLSTGDIIISSDNGDIDIENMAGANMRISSSFGSIDIEETSAMNITAESDNGGIELEKVSASAVKLDCSFGSIEVENSSLGSLYAESDNGSVKIEESRIASIEASTSFGSVSISETDFTSCHAKSASGKVILEKLPMNAEETSIKARTSQGSVSIDGKKQANSYERTVAGEKANIDASASFGDIVISFK